MIEIRTLSTLDDLTDLISLSREFFSEYESYHREFFKIDELTEQDITGYFSSFCDQPFRLAYIAVDDGRIVGYITVYIKEQAPYWQVKKVGEISGLMVQREYRGQGIGKKLLAQARDYLTTQGAKYFTLYTSVENNNGLRFYEQNGLSPLYATLIGEV